MRRLLPALCTVILFSCNHPEPPAQQQALATEQPEKTHSLTGTWTNIYTKVSMNTFQNSDSSKVMEMKEENWEAITGMKPIKTFLKADGTYNSEHRNLNDSIVYNPAGNWIISGDSLTMIDTFPKQGITYKYKFALKDNIVEFWGVEDFDQDGMRDDTYYGIQKKQ